MTVAVNLAGLLWIIWGMGTGSEVMQSIAAPMVGGAITAPLRARLAIPVVYLLLRHPRAAQATSSVFRSGRHVAN